MKIFVFYFYTMDLKNSKYQHCSKRIVRAMRTSSDDFDLIIVALWSFELLKYVPKKPSHSTNLTISIFTQGIYKKESATIVDNSVRERFEKAATIFSRASWRCGRSNLRNITMVKTKLSACGGDRPIPALEPNICTTTPPRSSR